MRISSYAIIITAVLILGVLAAGAIPTARAAIFPTNIWRGACGASDSGGPTGICTFCDALIVARNIINFLVALAATVSVAMIVYGGIEMMIGGGPQAIIGGESKSKVTKGKKTITSAIVGFVIALSAWIIVGTTLQVLNSGATTPPLPWNTITCT